MALGSVVMCPDLIPTGYDRDATAGALRTLGVPVVLPVLPPGEPGDDERTAAAHWVAHLSIALAASRAVSPLTLVFAGPAGALAPAVALSQRAARREVRAYVFVDATLPASGAATEWPDAPVLYIASPAAPAEAVREAGLRTWTVVPVSELSGLPVAAAIARQAGD